MLPTPSTSHVSFDTVYEPAEDSYLFLDTLSSESEAAWLTNRFNSDSTAPLLVEVGSGSGVVIAFAGANAQHIFGRDDILVLPIDVNNDACRATRQTVQTAIAENDSSTGSKNQGQQTQFVGSVMADLVSALKPGSVDVLLFNPPYVPTPDVPATPSTGSTTRDTATLSRSEKFEYESYLLSLSYAGGADGMEITNRFIDAIPSTLNPGRGVAYLLLCAQNKPEQVKTRIVQDWQGWTAEIVGRSGVKAGWEKLVILRICREET
jgi:release factor glutamine methyltransferase